MRVVEPIQIAAVGGLLLVGAVSLGVLQHRRGGRPWVPGAARLTDASIAVLAVVATGAGSLVLEDSLPIEPDGPSVSISRWMLAAGTTGLLLYALRLRRRFAGRFGTVFYVQWLATFMTDRHAEQAHRLRAFFREVRAFDRPMGSASSDLDSVEHVETLAREVSDSMRTDDQDSGFHLAPNLLWPYSAALGSLLTERKDLELLELRTGPSQGLQLLEPIQMRWSLAGHEQDETSLIEVRQPLDGLAQDGMRLVAVDLAETDSTTVPPHWCRRSEYRVGVFDETGATVPLMVDPVLAPSPGGLPVVRPWAAAKTIVAAIGRAVHDAGPGEQVYVMGRMPKTVAVGVGFWLKQSAGPFCDDGECRRAGCLNPWSQVVPLRIKQPGGDQPDYDPVRVHRDLPGIDMRSFAAYTTPSHATEAAESDAERRVVNLTPHPVVLRDADGKVVRKFPPSGGFARLREAAGTAASIDVAGFRVPTRRVWYTGDVDDLPPAEDGTILIVSRVLAAQVARDDLVFPDGELRDKAGQIIGCTRLASFDHQAVPHA